LQKGYRILIRWQVMFCGPLADGGAADVFPLRGLPASKD